MAIERPPLTLNYPSIPPWVGQYDEDWRFWILSYASTRQARYTGSREACEARLVDSKRFVLWHDTWERFPDRPSTAAPTAEWMYGHADVYVRRSYLRELPPGVNPCLKCQATKQWIQAALALGLEAAIPPTIQTVQQWRALPSFARHNCYVVALRSIYFSHFGLIYNKTTIKTLRRSVALRGVVDQVIEELLALGIVYLVPAPQAQTVYVRYQETVPIATALEVLSWHGKP